MCFLSEIELLLPTEEHTRLTCPYIILIPVWSGFQSFLPPTTIIYHPSFHCYITPSRIPLALFLPLRNPLLNVLSRQTSEGPSL